MSQAILSARGLSRHFPVEGEKRKFVKAVSEVNLDVFPGETLALVGESGCGKTTLSRLLLALDEASAGSLLFKGQDSRQLTARDWQQFRHEVQPVFQNPYASLDPRMRVGRIVAEPMFAAGGVSKVEMRRRVGEALEATGLQAADADKFPHQFSGGQRQRVAIARAIVSRPRLVVLDEPVSSQDISIQAQILNLLKDLQAELGMSYLFIAHDLATVRFLSDRVAVMYLGRIVESGPCETVFAQPMHPYTRALLAAVLPEHPRDRQRSAAPSGELPSPMNPPPGCAFHTRCPEATSECTTGAAPPSRRYQAGEVACLHADIPAADLIESEVESMDPDKKREA